VKTCVLCGHRATLLGGNADGKDLCHGCSQDHPCYRAWTVYGVRVSKTQWMDTYGGADTHLWWDV
jgi:hypothetical protein